MKLSLKQIYQIMTTFQNNGERILFTFVSLYADINGATPSQQGIMLSLQNILAFAGQQFFGRASDRFGRPSVIFLGYIISLISSILMFNFNGPITIIVVYAFYNIGFSAVQPAWNALIGDSFTDEQRTKMLGSIGSFATFTGGLIYLAAGLLSQKFENPFEFLFKLAGLSFGFAILVVAVLQINNRVPEREIPLFQDKLPLFDPLTQKKFRKFVGIDILFAFSMSITWPLFPRATNNLATTAQVSIIWFITFLFFAIAAKYANSIKKIIVDYNKILFLSRCMMWIVPFGFAIATIWWHLLLVRAISGFSFGLYSITQKDYILETSSVLGRPQDRGWFFGSHSFVWGISTFFGSLLSGYVSEYLILNTILGYSELFFFTAIVRFVFAFAYLAIPSP